MVKIMLNERYTVKFLHLRSNCPPQFCRLFQTSFAPSLTDTRSFANTKVVRTAKSINAPNYAVCTLLSNSVSHTRKKTMPPSALKLYFPARISTIICLWIFSGVQELRSVFQTALSSPAPLLSFVCRVELFSPNMLYFVHEIVD